MRKVTDLTPRFSNLPPAEQEFITQYNPNELPLGQSAGGLSLYSTKFKRGAGDKVFGNDENGMWLGKADYDDAPFRVDYDGNVVANSIKLSTASFISASAGLNQQVTSGTPVDVTGSSFSFTLRQTQIVQIIADATGWMYQASGAGNWYGNGLLRLIVNGVEKTRTIIGGGVVGGDANKNLTFEALGLSYFAPLPAGDYAVKLTMAADQIAGNAGFNLYGYNISSVTLGNY